MARGEPDEGTYQPQVQPEDLPRKIVPRANEESIGPGLQAVGQAFGAIDKKYQADQATWAGDELAKARTQTLAALQQARENAPAGDQTGFTDKFLTQFDKSTQPLVQAAGTNSIAGGMVQKGLSDFRDTLQQNSLQWEAQQNVAYRTNTLQDYVKSQSAVVEAHPEMRGSVGGTAMDMLNSSGLEPAKRLPVARAIDGAFSEAAANGMTRQDPQGMYHALTNPESASPDQKSAISGLSDAQRETVLNKAKTGLSANYSNSVVDTYRNAGPIAGAQALKAIDSIDQPDDIKEQIRGDVEKGMSQWHAEARQTRQQDIMGLEERLGSGKTQPSDVGVAMSLWRSGAFTAEQTGETIGRIQKAQEKGVDDQSLFTSYDDAYKKGQGLDPKDKDAKAGIDAVFQHYTDGVQPGSQEWINRGADIAAKTGITPESLVSWARTSLVSGSPQVAAQAADAMTRQQDANPRGVGYAVDPETKSMAKMITDATHAGTDPMVAVENARKITSMPDGDKQRLEEMYHANQNQISKAAPGALSSEIQGDTNWKTRGIIGFRTKPPDPPPSMTGEFEELRQNYYKLTNGNISQANDLAFKDLKNTWGITQVNGAREFMQFAPESMNPGLTTENLRNDMQESAKGHTDDPSKVRLIPTPDTFHSQGQRWGLGVPDKYGAYDVVRDSKGEPIPYQIPSAAASFQATRAKAAEEGMAKLHTAQAETVAAQKEMWDEINRQANSRGFK